MLVHISTSSAFPQNPPSFASHIRLPCQGWGAGIFAVSIEEVFLRVMRPGPPSQDFLPAGWGLQKIGVRLDFSFVPQGWDFLPEVSQNSFPHLAQHQLSVSRLTVAGNGAAASVPSFVIPTFWHTGAC